MVLSKVLWCVKLREDENISSPLLDFDEQKMSLSCAKPGWIEYENYDTEQHGSGEMDQLLWLICKVAWGDGVSRTTPGDWIKAKMILQYASSDEVLQWASTYGHFAIAEWSVAEGATTMNLALDNACQFGHMAIVQWAVAEGATNLKSALNKGCTNGHIAIVQWAIAQGATNRKDVIAYACYHRRRAIVKWLCVDETDLNLVLRCACRYGDITIAKWAVAQGATELNRALLAAIGVGHWAIVRWTRSLGAIPTGWLCGMDDIFGW